MFLILFCILLTMTVICDSARILFVVPTPSISHQVVFRPISLELAKRGHEVVSITTDTIYAKENAPENYTEIDVHEVSYEIWKKYADEATNNINIPYQIKNGLKQIEIIFEKQIQTSEVQKLINDKKQKFDLIFIEGWVMSTLAFTHIFKAPVIQMSTLGALPGMHRPFGSPTHFLLYPLAMQQKFLSLTIWQKISQCYSYNLVENIYAQMEESVNLSFKKMFGNDFPTFNELEKNIDMMFLNVHSFWDFNRPVPPNVIYLGGLHQNRPKILPQELKNYLDSSTNGVIYMSLGTNVNSAILPRETIKVFLKVFAKLPYDVLWKWNQDELEGRSTNVNISKWFPQSDLLLHPNVKLFITQGGLQSTDESITAGVPLVGIPVFLDQWFNTELYLHHKIGVKLDIKTLNEEDLLNAINTVLKDKSYRTNIVKLRNIMKDQPQTSLERAIWWTEYVLRHGGARHLRASAANMTWTEYLEVKLVAVVLVILLALITILFILINSAIRFIFYTYVKLKVT